MYILGLHNFANYESTAALIRVPPGGGRIEYVSISEDRLTRKKHNYDFPLLGLEYCLQEFGVNGLEEVEYLVTDYAREPRWHNSGPGYPVSEQDYLKLKLDFPDDRIRIYDHHDAHAAGAFYPSGFEEAAVLVVDGMGSRLNTQSLYHAREGRLELIERGYGWGIGKLYSLVTSHILPYGPEKGFGKVMGLAPYGRNAPGPVLRFGAREHGMTTDYSAFYSRQPVSRITVSDVKSCPDRGRVMEPYFSRAAFDVQAECERRLLRMAEYAYEKTGSTRLCLTGGVALNGRANHLILTQTPIRRLWIPPCCGDSGIPLGAALWAVFMDLPHMPSELQVKMDHASTGRDYRDEEILECLHEYRIDPKPAGPEEAARLIAQGKVVARFAGGSEIGPRALGRRSILADPTDPGMKDRLNSGIKFREPFRPFAPSVLEEYASDYFNHQGSSPFMLLVCDVRPEKQTEIPAVCHIDGTARPQDVSRTHNPSFYRIIDEFRKLTGTPLVLNTSFNLNREPIVETPLDALICALSTKIDYLVFNDRYIIDCAVHRSPSLVGRMKQEREQRQKNDLLRLREKHLTGYDLVERDAFIRKGSLQAEHHLKKAAREAAEAFVEQCLEEGKAPLIIGTAGHTQVLYEYIDRMDRLPVLGCFDPGFGPGEPGCFPPDWRQFQREEMKRREVEAILISTHEYQAEARAEAEKFFPGAVITTLYDTAMDSLYYILPQQSQRISKAGPAVCVPRVVVAVDEVGLQDHSGPGVAPDQRYAFIINYHYIHPQEARLFPGLHGIEPKSLKAHLAALVDNFHFIPTEKLWDPKADVAESSGIVTFDDGMRDVIEYAFPIMQDYGVVGTVFICSEPYLEGRVMSVQKRQLLLGKMGLKDFSRAFYELLEQEDFSREDPNKLHLEKVYPFDPEPVRQFKLDLNYLIPYAVLDSVLDRLFEEKIGNRVDMVKRLYMSRDDLRRLSDAGWEIGAHTHRHRVMSRLSENEQREEIEVNRAFLQEAVGRAPFAFAYPFGRRATFNADTVRLLEQAGFGAGLCMNPEPVTPEHIRNRFTCPRFDNQDLFDKQDRLRHELLQNLSTGD